MFVSYFQQASAAQSGSWVLQITGVLVRTGHVFGGCTIVITAVFISLPPLIICSKTVKSIERTSFKVLVKGKHGQTQRPSPYNWTMLNPQLVILLVPSVGLLNGTYALYQTIDLPILKAIVDENFDVAKMLKFVHESVEKGRKFYGKSIKCRFFPSLFSKPLNLGAIDRLKMGKWIDFLVVKLAIPWHSARIRHRAGITQFTPGLVQFNPLPYVNILVLSKLILSSIYIEDICFFFGERSKFISPSGHHR